MSSNYQIHPRIGVARLGNSPGQFYLSPETVGGLPVECDANGNPLYAPHFEGPQQHPVYVKNYKDEVGRVRRQAAKFQLFATDGDGNTPVTLADSNIDHIEWTVHVANKKPVWYSFSELQGDLEFGSANSYDNQHITKNNPGVSGADRKALMIDPGPRTINQQGDPVTIDRYSIPEDYQFGSFPPVGQGGQQIDTLGELRMDDKGSLIALGGFGRVTGDAEITSFKGASGYWDDIADGYVQATIYFNDGTPSVDADPAWLMVGSPKFAPELVNVSTLYDTQYDLAIRKMALDTSIYDGNQDVSCLPLNNGYTPLKGFRADYIVNFEAQVKPIIDRMASYRWVADIPYLNDFANPGFDLTDASAANYDNRMEYFNFFRVPVLPEDYYEWIGKVENGPNTLASANGLPLLPLNSGDNSVTNDGPIYKFETLKATQYFFLYQWACGNFETSTPATLTLRDQLDMADVGNCVGAPFSPGIETCWIVRNEPIYSDPFQLKLAHFDGSNADTLNYYSANGLSTDADEATGIGCEPGDITKRMAIPWQSDFQECTVQTPNTTIMSINQFADGTGIEVPPAYYVYWWPPQSPMHVITGTMNPQDQVLDAVVSGIAGQPIIPAGQRVPYQRGVLNAGDMITSWSRLGFVINQGSERYPYFVETERNFQAFGQYAALAYGASIQAIQHK